MIHSPRLVLGWQTGDGRRRSLRSSWYIWLAFLWSLTTPLMAQAEVHHAGLIIVHGDGHITTRCVSFSEDSISGTELLQRAKIVWLGSDGIQGTAICALEGEGCPASDCFCHCQGEPCAYWTYFHLSDRGTWQYSGVGASGWKIHDGDIDGWVWGDSSLAPPAVSLTEICAPAPSPAPPSTATSAPTTVPTPLPPRSSPNDLPSPTMPEPPGTPDPFSSTPSPSLLEHITPITTSSPATETPPPTPPSYGYFLTLCIGLAWGYWRIKRQ